LARKRTLTEETAVAQYADCGFLAIFGDNGESYLDCAHVENCVCGIPLGEDGLLFRKEQSFPAFANGVEEHLGVKSGAVFGAGGGRVEFRVRRDFCSIGAGTAIFVEPRDS